MNKLKGIGKICLTLFCITIVAFLFDGFFYGSANPLQPSCANSGSNGLWLRYDWYAGKIQAAKEWDAMLERLRANQIEYAYFHVLTPKVDGTVEIHKLENAKKITSAVHAGAPKTKVIALLYVAALPQKDGVDLSQETVRKSLVKEALWLVNDCGFDGVQWDYEVAANNDAGLLVLLDDTRAALKREQLISVDTPMWYPNTLRGWNDDYFRAVSGKCDQICVMSYDSYLYLPRAYAWLLSQQVIHVSNDVAAANRKSGRRCKVLFGLPTYEDGTLAHSHYCESFANSLRGLKDGLNDARTDRATIDGIALFEDYTTDADEWKTYRDYWLRCPKDTKH